jgi:hypothetical protein
MSMLALVFLTAQREARAAALYRDRVAADRERLRSISADHPIVVSPSRLVIYPLIGTPEVEATDVAMALVDPALLRQRFPSTSDSADHGDLALLEQDVALVHNGVFGFPRLLQADSLARLDCFFIIELTDDPFFGERWLVHHQIERLRPHLFVARRKSEASGAVPDGAGSSQASAIREMPRSCSSTAR